MAELDAKTEGGPVASMLEPAVMKPYFDPNVLYCLCRKPETVEMIGCDTCDNWYHASCVGLDFAEVLPIIDSFPFICPDCELKAAAKKLKNVKGPVAESKKKPGQNQGPAQL